MTLNIPTDWPDITIRQFSEITRVRAMNLDPIEAAIEIVSIATGADRKLISSLGIGDLKKIYGKLSFVADQRLDSFPLVEKVIIDKVEYRAMLDIRKISGGQYIDLKTHTEKSSEIMYKVHDILSVFFIPKGKKYFEVPANEVADIFYNKMPITVAYPIAVFFWKVYNNSIRSISDYSNDLVTKKMRAIAETIKRER